MEIRFFARRSTRRMRDYAALPPMLLTDGELLEALEDESVDLDVERPEGDWQPIDVRDLAGWAACPLLPRRFIDGKDVGHTVAWLQSDEGYPVPVRLSQIGAIALRVVDGQLRREEVVPLERVVSMIIDLFPWDEVEELAIDLREQGFRLLPSERPDGPGELFDFERMRKTTQNRSNDEMIRLERQMLAGGVDVPTVVDGRLDPRSGAFDAATDAVVGVVKAHNKAYLHPQGWRVFYNLEPGQRTPAFHLRRVEGLPGDQATRAGRLNVEVVTWYLRLDGNRGELPNWGIVRVELPWKYFDQTLGGDFGAVNLLSRALCEYRCRDAGYGRAPVSLYPIQRAEESLGSIFAPTDQLAHRFYRLSGL